MGMRMLETCWAVFKWQAINLRNCCIWLVDLFECMIVHGLTNLKINTNNYILFYSLYKDDISRSGYVSSIRWWHGNEYWIWQEWKVAVMAQFQSTVYYLTKRTRELKEAWDMISIYGQKFQTATSRKQYTSASNLNFNPLNHELNPICYLLALLGGHHFLHVSRIRVKLLTFRLLMSYIYGAPILDVSRSHATTHHSR